MDIIIQRPCGKCNYRTQLGNGACAKMRKRGSFIGKNASGKTMVLEAAQLSWVHMGLLLKNMCGVGLDIIFRIMMYE